MGLLKDKVVIVTGGSRGIGKAIVIGCAKEGATVVFNYMKHKEDADDTVTKAGVYNNNNIVAENVSVTDFNAIKELVKKVKEKYNRIDVLVNNAGITRDNFFMMMKEKEWDDVVEVNLKGMFYFSKAVISTMMSQKYGKIINISSISGEIGREGQTNYATTKGGIIAFTKSLAREVGMYKINVNAVAPGIIDTAMTKKIPKNNLTESIKSIPLGRMGTPEEIAGVVVFLASDLSSFITGSVIDVNGGQI